ncbi:DUF5722 domain-containing protein [Prosthecobacter sp. SYSU 5D2]|uniref:DUF5722 domain-containing protein n=1 Tax=Prosthecobacter sp. SYSU 5D2 TaxID=3134134 RepID=UPI0031FF2658
MIRFLGRVMILFHAAAALGGEIPLGLGPHKDVEVRVQPETVLELKLGEGHPHFWTGIVSGDYKVDEHTVLALEYFAPSGLESVVLRYRVASGEMAVAEQLPVPLAETWQPLAFDLGQLEVKPAAGHPEMRFHFALNGAAGTEVQLRRIRLRETNAEEKTLAANREKIMAEREAQAAAILADIRLNTEATLQTVHVGAKEITLIGRAAGPVKVVGIPPEMVSFQADKGAVDADAKPDAKGAFKLTIARVVEGSQKDRALWRWRLLGPDGQWASRAMWPTAYGPAVGRNIPKLTAPHQKGIGMPPVRNADHDIFNLGVRHATMNVVLHALIRETAAPGWTPWKFEGRTYYLNEKQIEGHDISLRLMAEKKIIVSAILLVGNGRGADGKPGMSLTHPEAELRGIYSIPNLTAEEPAQFYRAALHLMAERWTRADGSCGRVSNWIMHNEIDQGATWTNMGAQPLARYLETYMRSARLMHHTARLFDPHARVFISLTHHWAKKSSGSGTYIVRDMLELFAEMARAEGDFEWGVAYHPYPRDLRNPDTWKDADLTQDFDTPYITPKNIEVLPAFLEQSRFLFAGKPRGILLSEQGFNTPTLSLEDQRRQVAGLIYMFRKLQPLKTIEAYHLHRYQDMPVQEGGLRLGIITETGEHKLGWEAYQAIGTEKEAEFEKMAEEVMKQGD